MLGNDETRTKLLRNFQQNWMKSKTIYNSRIWDICFPGSHNSGSYHFSHADSNTKFRSLIKAFVCCQDMTIYQQLEAGVRFLDIRILKNYIDDNLIPYCGHGGYRTVPFKEVCEQISRFIEQHPYEIIILSVKVDCPLKNIKYSMSVFECDFWVSLYLGKYIGDRLHSNTKICDLVKKRQKIIYFFGEVERYIEIESKNYMQNSIMSSALKKNGNDLYDISYNDDYDITTASHNTNSNELRNNLYNNNQFSLDKLPNYYTALLSEEDNDADVNSLSSSYSCIDVNKKNRKNKKRNRYGQNCGIVNKYNTSSNALGDVPNNSNDEMHNSQIDNKNVLREKLVNKESIKNTYLQDLNVIKNKNIDKYSNYDELNMLNHGIGHVKDKRHKINNKSDLIENNDQPDNDFNSNNKVRVNDSKVIDVINPKTIENQGKNISVEKEKIKNSFKLNKNMLNEIKDNTKSCNKTKNEFNIGQVNMMKKNFELSRNLNEIITNFNISDEVSTNSNEIIDASSNESKKSNIEVELQTINLYHQPSSLVHQLSTSKERRYTKDIKKKRLGYNVNMESFLSLSQKFDDELNNIDNINENLINHDVDKKKLTNKREYKKHFNAHLYCINEIIDAVGRMTVEKFDRASQNEFSILYKCGYIYCGNNSEEIKKISQIYPQYYVKLQSADSKRFRNHGLTRVFFLQNYQTNICENIKYISFFHTSRTLIIKSWKQTQENNTKNLIIKFHAWTSMHGRIKPRPSYVLKVLAAEITPPGLEYPYTSGEVFSFWISKLIETLYSTNAGIKKEAQKCNKLLMYNFLNQDSIDRLNCITHDFISNKLILIILVLQMASLKANSDRV